MVVCDLCRKTRVVFDIALSVHQKIQKRDLEVGRSFGNCILRWLDRAKPSAQICTSPPAVPPRRNTTKHDIINMSRVPQSQIQNIKAKTKTKTKSSDSARRLFSTPWSIRPKGFPNIAMMMQPPKSITADNQYRQQYNYNSITLCTENMCRIRASQNVFRKDIAMLIHQSLK